MEITRIRNRKFNVVTKFSLGIFTILGLLLSGSSQAQQQPATNISFGGNPLIRQPAATPNTPNASILPLAYWNWSTKLTRCKYRQQPIRIKTIRPRVPGFMPEHPQFGRNLTLKRLSNTRKPTSQLDCKRFTHFNTTIRLRQKFGLVLKMRKAWESKLLTGVSTPTALLEIM